MLENEESEMQRFQTKSFERKRGGYFQLIALLLP
jgi:hypothetical protein